MIVFSAELLQGEYCINTIDTTNNQLFLFRYSTILHFNGSLAISVVVVVVAIALGSSVSCTLYLYVVTVIITTVHVTLWVYNFDRIILSNRDAVFTG